MCIICNMADETGMRLASDFLIQFTRAQCAMKAASDALLAVSKIATTHEHRQRYDAIHKEMVRQCREWNKLEQKRESPGEPVMPPINQGRIVSVEVGSPAAFRFREALEENEKLKQTSKP